MRKLLLTAAASTLAASLAAAGAAQGSGLAAHIATSGSRPTGNARAIGFQRAVQRAYGSVAGIDYTQRGFVVISDRRSAPSFFQWRWGIDRYSGMVRAKETAVARLRHGRTVWVLDTLSARHETSVQILVNGRGQYWRFADSRHLGCFNQLAGTVPWRVGSRWITVDGAHYLTLRRRGPDVLSRHRFPWSSDQTALESDTVSPISHLILSYTISVPRGSRPGQPGFKFSATYDNLTVAPKEPRVTLCKS